MKTIISLILAAALTVALVAAAPATNSTPADVVIVGAGISGLSAALEAGRTGAKVIVVEMASVFGGHAVMAHGMVCIVGTPEQRANQVIDSVELASADFLSHGEDANRDWVRLYAQNSRRDIYDWLQDVGVTGWELFPDIIPGNSVRRQHVVPGRGVGLVSPIYRQCLRYTNITFRWNTRATAVLVEAGRVSGVRGVHQRTGQTSEFRSAFVVLATGGFESNLELVRAYWPQYLPPWTESTRILLGSGMNAVGSGLKLAERTGAALAHLDHQLFYSTGLVDPREQNGRRGLHAFNPAAIWVNAAGKRFVRDGPPDPKNQIPRVLEQTPPTYWQIFDAGSRPQFFVSGSDWNDPRVVEREIFANPKLSPWVKRADSIEGLARLANLPAETLAATVQRWNGMIDRGEDTEFQRFDSSSPIRPRRIATPPFFGVQLFPLARKSLGGVAVDLSCGVVDRNRRPIPGLYAVGELAGVGGINGKGALEGTMLGPGILMGRIAAKDVVRQLRPGSDAAESRIESEPVSLPPAGATEPETLRAWREVLRQLLAQSRPGYIHFEKAHTAVLARGYDCARCHREASPLALTEDQLDRRAMIQSCAICHGGVRE